MKIAGAALALSACAAAQALEPVVDFGENPGNLLMFEHVPDDVVTPAPLVLALHGCSQDRDWAGDAGFVALADEFGFIVVVAEQKSVNNGQRCFNWFEPSDIDPHRGESASLVEMIQSAKARHDVDDERVFVAGLSSGGAMTVALLATAPDVFAAGASFAGLPYRCGTGVFAALSCQSSAPSHTQEEWASLVTDTVDHTGPWPRLLAVQGDDDGTVDVSNLQAITLQWTGLSALPAQPTSTTTTDGRTTKVFSDALTTITIADMDHGIPVDPPSCGTRGSFAPDVDFCGARAAIDFFGLSAVAEGEGEGDVVGEGEGGDAEGESAGEGEGGDAEGESAGEGEGEGEGGDAEGESAGEGEGDTGVVQPESCTCGSASTTAPFAVLWLLARRRRR